LNPLLPPHSADPWIIFHEGWYYYCESRNDQRSICIRTSRTIAGIADDPGAFVWHAPPKGATSNAVWAPELHWLDGRWYIYFAADNGYNENHRMWVLESETSDARGNYRCRGPMSTGGWAIDGTVLEEDGSRYFIWSGWPGRQNGQQNLYAALMKDPLTLAGPRVLLCTPDQPWERRAMPICEGPQVLKRNGTVFLVYSASGSWTPDYCLGMLIHRSGDILNPDSWEKRGPVFEKTEQVWGVGHCSFVKSPCQTEDWILYHSKSLRKHGWEDRDVHAKKFGWSADGLPDFGSPLPRVTTSSVALALVSPEALVVQSNAPLTAAVAA
jgi:GH43 family beta-xylosidase